MQGVTFMLQKKNEYSIRKLFETEFERFRINKSFPSHVLKAVQAIRECRTPVYGGHMYGCPDEHFSLVLFNSCKKRNCPTCQNAEIEYWNHVQKHRLLNTGHYHIVFKQPDILHSEFVYNYSEYANLIFDAARDTLKKIVPQRLKPGIILQLHTHGHNNAVHPHIHCAITDGGMNEHGKYEKFDADILNNENVLQVYQKLYLLKLRKRIRDGRILHHNNPVELSQMILEKGMSVFVSNRYDRGEWLISYLARNSRGGSIKDNQIRYVRNGKIGYWYQSSENKTVNTEMCIDTFIQRFLYHIPPDRYNTIRYCGLYATGSVDDYQEIRKQLNQEPYVKPARGDLFEKDKIECPLCNKKLVHQESFERNSIPFLLLKKLKFNPLDINSRYWQHPEQMFGLKYQWSEYITTPPLRAANHID